MTTKKVNEDSGKLWKLQNLSEIVYKFSEKLYFAFVFN